MKKIIAIILLCFATSASAEQEQLGLSFFGSFLHTSHVPNALFFFADIQEDDSFELRRALRTHDIDTLVLASSGGSVWEALNMAGIIFDKKMNTYIPPMPISVGCYSACSYMFFAGQNRLLEGELGVHQVGSYDHSVDTEKEEQGRTQQTTQFTTSEVIGFLNEFGTPPWVYEKMFRSRELYIFTDDEATKLNKNIIQDVNIQEIKAFIDDFLEVAAAYTEQETESTEQETESTEQETERKTNSGFSKTNPDMLMAVQKLLNDAKCEAGLADGIWGRKTASAALRFANANNLSVDMPELIDSKFIETLTSTEFISCPPATKPERIPTVSGKWILSLNCPNGTVSGNATISYQRMTDFGEHYSVSYSNNIGGVFTGDAYATNTRFEFSLRQTNGNSHSRGIGSFSNNRRIVNGHTEAGCAFVAASQ